MATLKELRTKFNANNLLKIFNESIKETEEVAIDLLRSQLSAGESGDGGQMPSYSSKYYARYKQRIGSEAPFGVVDLKLTGAFYSGFYLRRTAKGFIIRSKDKKNNKILQRYGSEVLELNDENLTIYVNNYLIPSMLNKIK